MRLLDKILRRKKSVPERGKEAAREAAEKAGEVAERVLEKSGEGVERTKEAATGLAHRVRGDADSPDQDPEQADSSKD